MPKGKTPPKEKSTEGKNSMGKAKAADETQGAEVASDGASGLRVRLNAGYSVARVHVLEL